MADNVPVVRVRTDIDGGPIPRGRVSKRLEKAIRLIEEEGFSLSQAAEATEYRAHSLTQALRKPHVRAFRADVKRAWRDAAAPKAWNRITKLSEQAGSEKVQLEAAKTILTALGDLLPEGAADQPHTLIQFIQNQFRSEQSLTQRLPGVVQVEEIQDADFEALDSDDGLTPGGEP